MEKIKYREGDWFAVPLRNGGFAVGLVARANPKAALLGYFFGPERKGIPSPDDLPGLRAKDAVLVGMFGHLGLTQGSWPTIGRLTNWDRAEWPMPVFLRVEELTGRAFNVFYADDGLMGAGYVEKSLTSLLRGSTAARARH
jgi:hypothetical protein